MFRTAMKPVACFVAKPKRRRSHPGPGTPAPSTTRSGNTKSILCTWMVVTTTRPLGWIRLSDSNLLQKADASSGTTSFRPGPEWREHCVNRRERAYCEELWEPSWSVTSSQHDDFTGCEKLYTAIREATHDTVRSVRESGLLSHHLQRVADVGGPRIRDCTLLP